MPPSATWAIPQAQTALVVGVADMEASSDPAVELVTCSLGSCLGVMVYDPVKKAGGLLHVILPDSSLDTRKAAAHPYMFVDTGVPRLLQAVYHLGGERTRLIIKLAGGAEFLDANPVFNIARRNHDRLREVLAQTGLSIHAEDVGGTSSRTVRLNLGSGRVTIFSPGINPH